jgi:hypothetical protein
VHPSSPQSASALVNACHWEIANCPPSQPFHFQLIFNRFPVATLRAELPLLDAEARKHRGHGPKCRVGPGMHEAHRNLSALLAGLDALTALGDGRRCTTDELVRAIVATGEACGREEASPAAVDQAIAAAVRALAPSTHEPLLVAMFGVSGPGRHPSAARELLLRPMLVANWDGEGLPGAVRDALNRWAARQQKLVRTYDDAVLAALAWQDAQAPLPGPLLAQFFREAVPAYRVTHRKPPPYENAKAFMAMVIGAGPGPAAGCAGAPPDQPLYRPAWELWELVKLIVAAHPDHVLNPGEAWTDRALAQFAAAGPDTRAAWTALLRHATGHTGSTPSKRWERLAREHLDTLGPDRFQAALCEWLPLVAAPRTLPLVPFLDHCHPNEELDPWNRHVLQNLVWIAGYTGPGGALARALGSLVDAALRVVPDVGPRAPKLANTAVSVLTQAGTPAADHELNALAARVTHKSTRRLIDKALDARQAA